jgi:hypothetical protein
MNTAATCFRPTTGYSITCALFANMTRPVRKWDRTIDRAHGRGAPQRRWRANRREGRFAAVFARFHLSPVRRFYEKTKTHVSVVVMHVTNATFIERIEAIITYRGNRRWPTPKQVNHSIHPPVLLVQTADRRFWAAAIYWTGAATLPGRAPLAASSSQPAPDPRPISWRYPRTTRVRD